MGFKVAPRYLIVPPAMEQVARDILQSPFTSRPEVEILRPERTQLVVSNYLTDKDAWYVAAPRFSYGTEDWKEAFRRSIAKTYDWPVAKNLHLPNLNPWRDSLGF